MLDAAARVVRPGGRLTYATCSSEPEENELVVDAFLARHPEFTRVPVEFGGAVAATPPVLRNQAGFLQTTPFEHGLDAFFAATLGAQAAVVHFQGLMRFDLKARPVRRRVWNAGRFFLLAAALAITFGVFFLAALRVATRAREVKVPDLRGVSVAEATTALAQLGLALRVDEVKRPDPKVPADHVLTQEPEPGVVMRRQRSVRVRVSDGQRDPIVPNVVGPARSARPRSR